MINRGSIRLRNKARFKRCVELRKQGLSYSEIQREVSVAKSTLQNWLAFAGLTLTKEHLEIQLKKRLEKQQAAVEAARRTRLERRGKEIARTLKEQRRFFNDPFYNYGIALYESEGSKETSCKFSNSDYRLIQLFVKFVENYFCLRRSENMSFEVYIHETRTVDLGKIKEFWAEKLKITTNKIKVYWKKNKIKGRRNNPEYVGQMLVRVKGESILGSKIEAISDIIATKYQRL